MVESWDYIAFDTNTEQNPQVPRSKKECSTMDIYNEMVSAYIKEMKSKNVKSLWDTLPCEIQDIIKNKAMVLHWKPVCDELKLFHKQRVRTYEYRPRSGIDLKCVKNTLSLFGRTIQVPCKGGYYRGTLYTKGVRFLPRDKLRATRYIQHYFPDYDIIRKSKKLPKLEKCSKNQLNRLIMSL